MSTPRAHSAGVRRISTASTANSINRINAHDSVSSQPRPPTAGVSRRGGGYDASPSSPNPRRYMYIPTSDDVNPHMMNPVDFIQPYDYRKHVKDNMSRKLVQRADEISAEVSHRLEEAFGLSNLAHAVGSASVSPSRQGGEATGAFQNRSGASPSSTSIAIPKPPPHPHHRVGHTPFDDAPSPARSAIYSPITVPPQSSSIRPASPSAAYLSTLNSSTMLMSGGTSSSSSSGHTPSRRPQSSPARRPPIPSMVSSSEMSCRSGLTADDGLIAMMERSLHNNSTNTNAINTSNGSAMHLTRANLTMRQATGLSTSRLSPPPEASKASATPMMPVNTIPVPTLVTRPSAEEVALAMALLRERSNNSPVKGVPFVAGGIVQRTSTGISGYNSARRLTRRPATASQAGGRGGSFNASFSNATTLQASNISPSLREEGDAQRSSARGGRSPYNSLLHAASATKSWAGETASAPRARVTINVLQKNELPPSNSVGARSNAFGGAGLGAGVGLHNPSDVTTSWMLLGDKAARLEAQRQQEESHRSRQRGHGQHSHSDNGSSRGEPLETPKAPLLRHPCPRADATYLPTRVASARRKQIEQQRATEERKELERIAAATVRMQADHDHRKALRQRRYLQGLALKQPFEVAKFRSVVGEEWEDVEDRRAMGVMDDIPSQVLAQRKMTQGGIEDATEQEAILERAVQAAHHTRFEKEVRMPQPQYSPRRELM